MAYDVVRPDEFEWLTRPHDPGEPARHVVGVHAALTAKSPLGSGEPAIRVGKDTAIEGVVIDSHRLRIELDL